MNRNSFRLTAAALSVLAVTSFAAAPAFADPGNPYAVGGTNQENPSNKALINPSATVQLSIHKYLGGGTGQPNNGTQQSINLPPLQGVNFDIYKVYADAAHTQQLDLTTNNGWTTASKLTQYTPSDADVAAGRFVVNGTTYYIGKVSTVTTNGTGTATFTQPGGVGVYLAKENLATSGTITNTATGAVVNKGTITPAKSFVVTLPMTNPDDTTRWMYDISVYPKNQSDTIVKTVDDKGTVTTDNGNVGDHVIDYSLTSSITDGTTPLGMYVIYDDLDPSLTFTGADLALSNGVALVPATDYVVYTAANLTTPGAAFTGGTVAGGPLVTIVLTDAGLTKLEANRAADVITRIHTTVGAEDADGMVPNVGSFIPNEGWWNSNGNPGTNPEDPTTPPGGTTPPGTPTNEVKTYYGDVVVNKQDPQQTGANMAGATFAVYSDPTPGDGTCSSSDVAGTPINTQTITANNRVVFRGLQTSNWYNNAEVTNPAQFQSYCLVETKAPAGYNLDATPIYLTIDYKSATTTAPAFTTQLVNNEKSNLGNSLPLTGGQGVAMLGVAGLLLVVGGVAYYVISNRRDEDEKASA